MPKGTRRGGHRPSRPGSPPPRGGPPRRAGGRPPTGKAKRPASPRPEGRPGGRGPGNRPSGARLGPGRPPGESAEPRARQGRPSPPPERPRADHAPETAGGPREGVALGFHAVRTALTHTPRRVERLLIVRGGEDGRRRHLVALAREAGIPFQEVPKEALDRLAEGVRHQGVGARLAGADLLSEEELLAGLPGDAIVLLLDGVEDPRNVGAILRSAAAFGASGVFLPVHHSAGISPAAVKTAAGAIGLVPVARAGNLGRLLDRLAEAGHTTVALDPEGGVAPWEARLAGPVALLAGGEERGIRPSLLGRCQVRVRIPIRPEIGSLNVGVAVGILLAEARRQAGKTQPLLDDTGDGC